MVEHSELTTCTVDQLCVCVWVVVCVGVGGCVLKKFCEEPRISPIFILRLA